MKKSFIMSLFALLIFIPNLVGMNNRENLISLDGTGLVFDNSNLAGVGCYISEPVACLAYYQMHLFYAELCANGEPGSPFCPPPCEMALVYWLLFWNCEIH